jgi:hypothetical protein
LIIKVAHLICDPLGAGHGQLYTYTMGTSSSWFDLGRTFSWRKVVPGDPLLPGIYEFKSTYPILLSKISQRSTHSMTSKGSESRASAAAFSTSGYAMVQDAWLLQSRIRFKSSHLVSS